MPYEWSYPFFSKVNILSPKTHVWSCSCCTQYNMNTQTPTYLLVYYCGFFIVSCTVFSRCTSGSTWIVKDDTTTAMPSFKSQQSRCLVYDIHLLYYTHAGHCSICYSAYLHFDIFSFRVARHYSERARDICCRNTIAQLPLARYYYVGGSTTTTTTTVNPYVMLQ